MRYGQNVRSSEKTSLNNFYAWLQGVEEHYIAFLVGALEAEGGAFGLDVSDATACVALFGGDAARLGTC